MFVAPTAKVMGCVHLRLLGYLDVQSLSVCMLQVYIRPVYIF